VELRRELIALAGDVQVFLRYLQSLGVDGLPRVKTPPLFAEDSTESFEDIERDLSSCRRCALCSHRTEIVFGQGDPRAALMFIGDFPDQEADRQGLPFLGEAGGKLTDIIEKGLRLNRRDCYLTTLVKCRPEGGRQPEPVEIATCKPFLLRQIFSVRPRVICVLGQTAAQGLLNSRESLAELRRRIHDLSGYPVVPTYDPRYLLEHADKRREVWEDIQVVMARLKTA